MLLQPIKGHIDWGAPNRMTPPAVRSMDCHGLSMLTFSWWGFRASNPYSTSKIRWISALVCSFTPSQTRSSFQSNFDIAWFTSGSLKHHLPNKKIGFKPSPNIFPHDPTTGTANVGGSVTPRCIASRSIGRHQEGRCLKRGLHPWWKRVI